VIPPLEFCLLRIITNWPHFCKLKTCLLMIPGGKVMISEKQILLFRQPKPQKCIAQHFERLQTSDLPHALHRYDSYSFLPAVHSGCCKIIRLPIHHIGCEEVPEASNSGCVLDYKQPRSNIQYLLCWLVAANHGNDGITVEGGRC
jgi:hypothetical protein